MSISLQDYHCNPLKAGQILKQLCKERGISQNSHAAQIGVSYDKIGNNYAGKVQNFSFEFVLKSCVLLQIPMEVFLLLLLEQEDIDFRDRVLLYNNKDNDVTPASDLPPTLVPDGVPSTVTAVAAATTAVPLPDVISMDRATYCLRDDLQAVLARVERHHSDQIAQLVESRRLLIEQHDKAIEVLREQIARQDELIRTLIAR